MGRISAIIGCVTLAAAAYGGLSGLFPGGLDHPAIQYNSRPVSDPVSLLNRKLASGTVHLRHEQGTGYLRAVLDALDVPVESQMAVFSKTSFQAERINPRNPRTLFFNDSVAVGWVRGGPIVELAAEDPRQGVIFYTLDQHPAKNPQFVRTDECLRCHESYSSLGVPGMLSDSGVTRADGTPLNQLGSYVTDDRSPLEQRWGGWFVTGKTSVLHMGNRTMADASQGAALPLAGPDTLASLQGQFDTRRYLTPYSDIAALMVFEHQMRLTNLLTRVGWESRAAEQPDPHEDLFGRGPSERKSAIEIIRDAASELADALLFVDEAPIPGKIEGTSGFTEKFAVRGPRDSQGRTLRQLDLENRLMRYPLSYVIYNPAFDALPSSVREATYHRLWEILGGAEKNQRYKRLSLSDRRAIVEILRETKPGLPDYFRPVNR